MIDTLPQQLDYNYQDYWGEYLPPTLEPLWALLQAGCYVPRWFQVPNDALETMAVGGYNAYAVAIPAGSFIIAILHSFQEGVSGAFTVQITDTALDHQWFSQAAPDQMFFKENGRNGYLLPKPYPVITPGNFLVERWCYGAGSCELTLLVAEPRGVAVP